MDELVSRGTYNGCKSPKFVFVFDEVYTHPHLNEEYWDDSNRQWKFGKLIVNVNEAIYDNESNNKVSL